MLDNVYTTAVLLVEGDQETDLERDDGLNIVNVEDICEPYDYEEQTELHRHVDWMQTLTHRAQVDRPADAKRFQLDPIGGSTSGHQSTDGWC